MQEDAPLQRLAAAYVEALAERVLAAEEVHDVHTLGLLRERAVELDAEGRGILHAALLARPLHCGMIRHFAREGSSGV